MLEAFKMMTLMTFLLGAIYPVFCTGISQMFFSKEANGSLIINEGKVRGSELLSQNFVGDQFFHARPSAINHDPKLSGATNFSPVSKMFKVEREKRAKLTFIPELQTSSASGLDPHLSRAAVYFQLNRVADARAFGHKQRQELEQKIDELTERPRFGFMGTEMVNVTKLNFYLLSLAAKI